MKTAIARQWTYRSAAAIVLVLAPSAIAAQTEGAHVHQGGENTPCQMPSMMSGGMMGSGMMSGGMMGSGMMSGHMMGTMGDSAMMAAMMTTMQYAPRRVLQLKEDLNLTADQTARLEALLESRKGQHQQMMQGAGWEDVESALESSEPDSAVVHRNARRMMRQQADMHAAMMGDAAAVRGLLTESQRLKVTPLCPSQESKDSAHNH